MPQECWLKIHNRVVRIDENKIDFQSVLIAMFHQQTVDRSTIEVCITSLPASRSTASNLPASRSTLAPSSSHSQHISKVDETSSTVRFFCEVEMVLVTVLPSFFIERILATKRTKGEHVLTFAIGERQR